MKKLIFVTITFNKLILILISVTLTLIAVLGIDLIKCYTPVYAELSGPPTIIIDAGHGGEDGGTVSADGILEKDINLKIAQYLNKKFIDNGYKTIMIRNEDKLIYDSGAATIKEKKKSDLHKRTAIANDTENSILISIHQNHYSESKYYGAQVFYSGNNYESELLAETIQSTIKNTLQPENNRQIKKSGSEIYLLYNSKIPTVMVECGFLSNDNEAKLLNKDEYQRKIAECIYNATDNYLINRK